MVGNMAQAKARLNANNVGDGKYLMQATYDFEAGNRYSV